MYIDECGRLLKGTEFELVDERGRISVTRPLQEIGRWTNYVKIMTELFDLTIAIGMDPTIEFSETICTPCWDLREMMPRKFKRSAMVMDYLHAISVMVNSIACRIAALEDLTSLQECPKQYLGHLGALIAYKFQNQQYASSIELKNQLKMAVEMYKIKGTYHVLRIAFYLIGLHAELYDLWTQDYVTFERRSPHQHTGLPGFIAPTGLISDSGYFMDETLPIGGLGEVSPWHFDSRSGGGFKSPHFDVVVQLDRIVDYQGYSNKLFVSSMYDLFSEMIDEYTPINTVPHFFLNLLCQTYENFLSYTIPSSQVKTTLTDKWTVSKLYFDDSNRTDETDPQGGTGFPDPWSMDQSFEAMLSTLTVVKLGTGNKGNTPSHTDTDLSNILWTGTVSSYNVVSNKVSFNIIVPAGIALAGLSELGIFNVGTGELVIESFFLDIDKPYSAVLEITVEVFRNT